ncbi:FAD-dependent oxidoreductase [Coleofasciculus sp.]|uniref:FAD-dependent oxidoreductase n=1 Tax=Coleofasciculus sp. TaxID=3100458 RepID=UPI0039FA0C83
MNVTIIGGGPAGIAIGYYAKKYGIKFNIFEANDYVGGNCTTLKKGDFMFDLGAHRLHDKNPDITDEIQNLMKDELKLINVPSQIFKAGKYIDFPLSPFDILNKLGMLYCLKSSFELLKGRLNSSYIGDNFESLALQKYGKTIAESFLLNYSKKLWGVSCDKLSCNVSGNRLKGLDFKTFLTEAFVSKAAKTKHLDGSFYYPKNGYGSIVERMGNYCGKDNIFLNSKVTKIWHDHTKIIGLEIREKETMNIDKMVSTIPINILLKIMTPSPPQEILKIADSLRFRHLRLVALFLDKESITPNATVYFPEANFPFTRIYEPKNRSSSMSPPEKTSLVAEIPCQYEDEIWSMTQKEIVNLVKEKLIYIDWIKKEEIIDSWVGRINYAYPVLEIDFEDKVERIMNWLYKFGNLNISGRNGKFLYTHLHDQMKFGQEIIEQCICPNYN